MAEEKPLEVQQTQSLEAKLQKSKASLSKTASRAARLQQAQILVGQAHPLEVAWMSEILDRPWRIFYLNTIAGIGRGLGFALGVTILAGAVLTIGYRVAKSAVTLPWVGQHVAEFISEVQQNSDQFKKMRP